MLTVRDLMRLEMADANHGPWFSRAGRVRDTLGESETAMWVRVGELLDDPEAVAAMPAVVARLRRLREERAAARSERARLHI